jgi:putative NADPH-quinone reductase
MRVLLVVGHPDPGSFNHAIASVVRERLADDGHEVSFHDLCAEGFESELPSREIPKDSVPDGVVARHCAELAEADGVVVVHPNWWGMPPAIVTGWVDRVFRPGVAYEFLEGDSGEGVPAGLLEARSAVVFNTSNTTPSRETEAFGDPLDTIWRRCVFGLCGVGEVHRRTFSTIVESTSRQRAEWLAEAAEIVGRLYPPS